MSIEMNDPKTALEMADALTNLVEQMVIAHRIGDENRFKIAYDKAASIGFDLLQILQEQG